MARFWGRAGLWIWPLSLTVATPGCADPAEREETSNGASEASATSTTGTGNGTTASTGASSDAPTSDGPTSAGPTSGGPTSGGPGTSGGSDSDADAPACPLSDPAGVATLALSPELYADGGDPSNSAACDPINPERGFYQYVSLRTLDESTLADAAADGLSLLYGQVLIPEFRDSPLDAALLNKVSASLDLVREHGMKVVPRFHYSDDIDEPDADLQRILGHIEQLKPILQEHADVILTLQAGFIGAWGEWHASQNGLDAAGPRKQILDALLAALPANRTVSVRRPSFKDDAYGGPLAAEAAYDGSALARVGHINDCFLASDDDEGTYQVDGEKEYAITDSAFVPVGGETCGVNPPRSECPAALDELALHHWTFLNLGYHPDVVDGWKQAGCFDEIACRLGYRLAVREIRWAEQAAAGGPLPVSLRIFNDGFAAPVNQRPLILVFDGPTRVEVSLPEVDARRWMPGAEATLCVDAQLPADLPPGSYHLGLRLPDAAATLAGDPRQSIRLVNGEWDPANGINWFDAMVQVE
ncbi:MAG: DUF4832 domain-containing protein [Nannocystis sp.]|nr:DUF4832 domain-containing protein [Nannocystis sp.]MBA3545112.1 DUF4832 domain-containing protein [Nannocystis sp.]